MRHSVLAMALIGLGLLLTHRDPVNAFARTGFGSGDGWQPVDSADLSSKTPTVEPDADAEGIFWDVSVATVADTIEVKTVLEHYIRIKIYTDRGKESQANVDIPFKNNYKIDNIAARTIKPDGKIIEVKKEDIFERTIVKAGGLKIKAKSFAMPGVEPGAVIEYRWRETRPDSVAQYMRLDLQRDIPIRTVRYHIKPLNLPDFPFNMRGRTFHTNMNPFVKEKDGFYGYTMTNVAAYREEPRMPPEYSVRPWLLVYYTEDRKMPPEKYWPQMGKEWFGDFKPLCAPNGDVKHAAAEATIGAATPDEKLQRIFAYCRTHVKNVNSPASGLSEEDKKKAKDNKGPGDTLKHGIGDGEDIDLLFAAMAQASGFDVRIARLATRDDAVFQPSFTDPYFLNTFDIAVRNGNGWQFFDPGTSYIPFGMLRWQEEGAQVLVCDDKNSGFSITPIAGPDQSKETRTAKLRLSDDGTLEGDVRVEFTGHRGVEMKLDNEDDSPAEREKTLTDDLKKRLPSAEVSNIKIENVTDEDKPFVYQYTIKVPGYAQRTGKRLFIQPAFFEYGVNALFQTSNRRYDIYFDYPWSEEDQVSIHLPAGFELDHPDVPGPITAGKVCAYGIRMRFDTQTRTIMYSRSLSFGGGNAITFPSRAYPDLKKLFDLIHEEDNHAITLRQPATAAASN